MLGDNLGLSIVCTVCNLRVAEVLAAIHRDDAGFARGLSDDFGGRGLWNDLAGDLITDGRCARGGGTTRLGDVPLLA